MANSLTIERTSGIIHVRRQKNQSDVETPKTAIGDGSNVQSVEEVSNDSRVKESFSYFGLCV